MGDCNKNINETYLFVISIDNPVQQLPGKIKLTVTFEPSNGPTVTLIKIKVLLT